MGKTHFLHQQTPTYTTCTAFYCCSKHHEEQRGYFSYRLFFLTEDSQGRNLKQKALEEHCLLDCFPWLVLSLLFIYISDSPAQVWVPPHHVAIKKIPHRYAQKPIQAKLIPYASFQVTLVSVKFAKTNKTDILREIILHTQ